MLSSEFLHMVNKYGATLKDDEEAKIYLRDAYATCRQLEGSENEYEELYARIDDYTHSCFPQMDVNNREKLTYTLTQCLAFEMGIIDFPDEHDVSYPGVGIIAEAIENNTYAKIYQQSKNSRNNLI